MMNPEEMCIPKKIDEERRYNVTKERFTALLNPHDKVKKKHQASNDLSIIDIEF